MLHEIYFHYFGFVVILWARFCAYQDDGRRVLRLSIAGVRFGWGAMMGEARSVTGLVVLSCVVAVYFIGWPADASRLGVPRGRVGSTVPLHGARDRVVSARVGGPSAQP